MRSRAYRELNHLHTDALAAFAAYEDLRPRMPDKWPEEVTTLVSQCWHRLPHNRPSFREIRDRLATWRNDPEGNVLEAIAKGSRRGLLERIGVNGRQWGEVRLPERNADVRAGSEVRMEIDAAISRGAPTRSDVR